MRRLTRDERLILQEAARIQRKLNEFDEGQRILDLLVPEMKGVHELLEMWEKEGHSGLTNSLLDLYDDLRDRLGKIEPAEAEALRRFKWVLENGRTADPALLMNNLGKGLNSLGSRKTPKFF